MTQQQQELYTKTKNRLRRMGKENPADVIVALAEEIEHYRAKIHGMAKELEQQQAINKLLERDIEDRDKMLEQKVEEVYPEFMRDYKCLREELEGVYEELVELRKSAADALGRLTAKKPIEEADDFDDRSLCCPHCLGPVTNYWAPGTKPKHCQFCGQALDWGEETTDAT